MLPENCPFCGKRLSINNEKPTDISSAIRIIVQQRGIEILHASKMVTSMVKDLLPGFDSEKKLFSMACNNGILDQAFLIVEEKDQLQRNILIQKTQNDLVQNAFMSIANANLALRMVLLGVGIEDLSVLTEIEQTEEQKNNTENSQNRINTPDSPIQPHTQEIKTTKKEINYKDGVYIGEALANRPHGFGTKLFTSGNKYEGYWNIGLRNGQGTYTFANGESWTGEWKNDSAWNGTGVLCFTEKNVSYRYEGSLKDGKQCGACKYYVNNMLRKSGMFVDGVLHGMGTSYLSNGRSCSGEFKNGRPWNAKGIFLLATSKTAYFTGEWVNGNPNGTGKILFTDKKDVVEGVFDHGLSGNVTWSYADGRKYCGDLKNGQLTGRGKLYSNANRLIWDGEFKNGNPCGKGILYFENGNRYEGEILNGKCHGQGTFIYPQGSWTGEWREDKRWTGNGLIIFYDKNGNPTGKTYNGSMVNGVASGQGVLRFWDGTSFSGEFLNDNYYNGYIYSAQNQVVDTYINGVSQREQKQAKTMKTLSVLSDLMGM